MTLKTDLSRKPYFDDYDTEKNFYRVLHRPGVPVQVRELNQTQSIIQDQIDKFGRSIYKEGSVVEGCSFTFDNNYNYIKIQDYYSNGSVINSLQDLVGSTVINSTNLRAIIVNSVVGLESLDPNLNTLYVKYLNSGVYPNGVIQTSYTSSENLQLYSSNVNYSNITSANVANVSGKGYAFTTTEGVIFKKGFFIRVEEQTLIVTKYTNVPDQISVGFDVDEIIVTPETDTTLLDNAAGSPNFDAPGAHRLKLVPTLVTRNTSDTANSSTFFSLVDFNKGLPVTIRNDPQYSALGKEMARRTFETNGNYIVNPFILSIENKGVTDPLANTHLNLSSSPGIGYVNGFRVEFANKNTVSLRKGLDYSVVPAQQITSNFGYYCFIKEYCGDFDNEHIAQVELHSITKQALTNRSFLSVGYNAGSKIGTAYVRGIKHDEGAPGTPSAKYKLYLFNINMNAGFTFNDVKSVIRYDSTVKAVADLELQYKGGVNAFFAFIQESDKEALIYPFGQKALKGDGFANMQFIYRNSSNQQFDVSGSMSIGLVVAGTGTETFYYQGNLSSELKSSYTIIPLSSGYSTNRTGTINVSSTHANVSGNSTTFIDDYYVGDYFIANGNIRRINSIVNNTLMIVDSAFPLSTNNLNHQIAYVAGVPINFKASGRNINVSGNTSTITLGKNANAAFQCIVYQDVKRSETVPIAKKIQKNTHIAIHTSNNSAGSNGPWCLGIPDVIGLKHVYVGNSSFSNTNVDLVNNFTLDTGQRDSYYGLSYLTAKKPLANNQYLLIVVDNFTQDTTQGKGFFNANSYPIDDVNVSNTQAIQTTQIPVYISSSTGRSYDLRNCIDYRPYVTNTALANATSNSTATVNPANSFSLVVDGAGSYLPSPDEYYQSTIEYYMPRKDRISLNSAGELIITEGVASDRPIEPNEVPGAMTIGIVDIAAYPTLTPADASANNRFEYSTQTTIKQNKRYTMSDIGKLANRINRLEYYTSLNLIEQSASSLLVRSDSTGLNRFKNGILVDPFKDHTIGQTTNPLYKIAVDSTRGEMRPIFSQGRIAMSMSNTESSNVVQTGQLITLNYDSVLNQSQTFASKFRNCATGLLYHYRGSVILDPPGQIDADITKNPDVTGDLDLAQNWVNVRNYLSTAYGTEWNNWTNTLTPSQIALLTSSGYTTTTINTSSQQAVNAGRDLQTQSGQNAYNIGDNLITNINIVPYIRSMPIFFKAYGLKPLTLMYAFFNNIPVSEYCYPLTPYGSGVVQLNNGWKKTVSGNYVYTDKEGNNYSYNSLYGYVYPAGGGLQTDASGNLYGIFWIPESTFRSGKLQFKLVDVSDLATGSSAITTEAASDFFATRLSIIASNLQVRDSTINSNEQNNIDNLNQGTTTPPIVDPIVAVAPPVYVEQIGDGAYSSPGGNYDTTTVYTGNEGGWVEVPTIIHNTGDMERLDMAEGSGPNS